MNIDIILNHKLANITWTFDEGLSYLDSKTGYHILFTRGGSLTFEKRNGAYYKQIYAKQFLKHPLRWLKIPLQFHYQVYQGERSLTLVIGKYQLDKTWKL